MKQRAYPLVVALLLLASLVGFTSAMNAEDLAVQAAAGGGATDLDVAGGSIGDGGAGVTADGVPSADGGSSASASGEAAGTAGGRGGGTGAGGSGGAGTGRAGAVNSGSGPLRMAYLVPDFTGVGAIFGTDPTGGDEGAEAGEREFQALIDDVNKSGGIHGRPIEARGFRFTIAEQADEPRLVERCVEITEDYKPAYVIDTHIMGFASAQQCFAQHGAVLVTLGSTLTEKVLRDLHPYVVTTDATVDRMFAALVPKLEETGYLRNARVGVLLDNTASSEGPYGRILEPALTRAGAKPVAVARATHTDQGGIQNAVLRFRSQNVSHVLIIGSVLHFVGFSNAAEAQGYRPRYGFSDYFTAASSSASLGNVDQLRNAVAVLSCNSLACIVENASRSSADVETPYDPNAITPGFRRCLDTLSRVRGTDYYRPAEAGSSSSVVWICDHFLLWLDAARAADPRLQPSQFAAAVRAIGRGFASPRIFATDFSDGRQAAATHFAAGVFDGQCRCYVRSTNWTPTA